MPDHQNPPVRYPVTVPIDGVTVQQMRQRAEELGLDADRPEVRGLLALEQVEPAWEAKITFEIRSDAAVPIAIELRSTEGRAVTGQVWQRVKVAQIVQQARLMVGWLRVLTTDPEQAETVVSGDYRPRSPGRPPTFTSNHYRHVAAVYEGARAAGRRDPVQAVAEAFESAYPRLTERGDHRARGWVAEARARGYLGTRTENEK